MMVAEETCLQESEGSEIMPYSQWLSRVRLSAKKKDKEGRNIFGIRILEESCAM